MGFLSRLKNKVVKMKKRIIGKWRDYSGHRFEVKVAKKLDNKVVITDFRKKYTIKKPEIKLVKLTLKQIALPLKSRNTKQGI